MPTSMLRRTAGAAGFAALLGLAACTPPWTPWTLTQSPDDITLRWYTDDTRAATADQIAALHCRSWGKTAELTSDAEDGSAEIAEYRCR